MALSDNGVRLYFSPTPAGYSSYSYGAQYGSPNPKFLQLLHVRLPPMSLHHPDEQLSSQVPGTVYGSIPQTQSNPTQYVVKDLEKATYVDGILVASLVGDVDGKDFILGICPDLSRIGSLGQTQGPSQPQPPTSNYYMQATTGGYLPSTAPSRPPLTEQATLLYLSGSVWAIATAKSKTLAIPPTASPEPLRTNELATQFSEPPQEFLVVSDNGVSTLVRRRTLDYLRDALEEAHSEGNLQPIIEFRDSYGRDQTCAMLLALASGNTVLASDKNRYSLYDEVERLSPDLAAIAKQAFYELGDRPVWVERGYGGDSHGNVIFSGRREGLAMYFARLVRPLWRTKVTKTGYSVFFKRSMGLWSLIC